MGVACSACGGPNVDDWDSRMEMRNDAKVTRRLDLMNREAKETIRILLLGTGDCGKSTLVKQLKLVYKGGFSKSERMDSRETIRMNTIDSIKQLITGCRELYDLEQKYEALADRVMELPAKNEEGGGVTVSTEDIDAIENLYKNSEMIKRAVEHKSLFYLLDSYEYFLTRVREIFKQDYMPSSLDILRARTKTRGIEETKFTMNDQPCVIYDVGGQRGERKKWIHIFDGVSIIGYVASLSEYDQVLEEDRNKNRMQESLSLFEGILSLIWFKETPVILFLNKNDIFQEKIKTEELGRIFPEYYGGFDAKEALEFIAAKYRQCNAYKDRTLMIHVTTAIETECISPMFERSVAALVVSRGIQSCRSDFL
mmetsp:Transcript_8488/g.13422  ORF Transcript_8488/g.13422 Transcript_8488/m.13422 type:complete len:368 (+) Transcript_8488:149-1252(+)